MNRYNLFRKIHKGLRTLLYDASLQLQRTDFNMPEETAEAVYRIQSVVTLIGHFQQSEDTYVLPAMMDYESGVADAFEQEHEEAYRMGRNIEEAVANLKATTLPFEKIMVSKKLAALFEEFTTFNILHMAREEQVVNKILWRYYTDAELQSIAWKIISAAETPLALPYSNRIIRGLNDSGIVRWLKEVKLTAKGVEFQSLLKTAEADLQPGRWNLLQDVVSTGLFIAN